MDELKRGRLQCVAAALCWSLAGACVKLAQPMDGWHIAGFRSLFAFFFIAALVRPWRARPFVPGVKVWLLSAAYAGMLILFILGNTYTTAANAIFLQDTAPVWVMLFAPLMVKEPFRLGDLGLLAVCGAGMTLLFLDDLNLGGQAAQGLDEAARAAAEELRERRFFGNALSAVSGIGFALVIVGLRWGRPKEATGVDDAEAREPVGGSPRPALVRPSDSELIVTWGNLLCFVACLPMMGPLPSPAEHAVPWAVVTAMGFVQLGLGYYLLTKGVKHVPAVESSLLLLIEPVLNPIWTYLAVRETPGPWALAGGGVIIATIAFQALRGAKVK